jgi:Rsm1-like/C3HC zinc finger-like
MEAVSNGQQDPSSSNSHHVSLSEAIIAIKKLDRFAFYGTLAEEYREEPLTKIQKVSDIVDEIGSETKNKPSRFSRLTGIGQLHREKSRQRRQSRTSLRKTTNDTVKATFNNERSSTYRPFSLDLLLERLSTFSISTYSNKPDSARLLSPLGMASNGWMHGEGQERDEVICVTCTANWKVEAPLGSTSKEAQFTFWKDKEMDVREKHEDWCPWRIRSCSPSLYKAPIRSVLETRADVVKCASRLSACPGFDSVIVASDLNELNTNDFAVKFPDLPITALILAIFGWQISGDGSPPIEQCIIACSMCARRAGLWAYTKDGKQFDVLKEHKSYCPIINGEVQNGSWMNARNVDLLTSSKSQLLPAWQLRSQLLLGNKSQQMGIGGSSSEEVPFDARNMRSSEILARVNALLDGRTN